MCYYLLENFPSINILFKFISVRWCGYKSRLTFYFPPARPDTGFVLFVSLFFLCSSLTPKNSFQFRKIRFPVDIIYFLFFMIFRLWLYLNFDQVLFNLFVKSSYKKSLYPSLSSIKIFYLLF